MDDPRTLHRRAGQLAGGLIEKITPAQLGLPTPCSQWDVRAVINHLVNANLRVTARLAGESGPERGDDVLGADPAADFRSSFEGLCAAFDEDGFLERTVPTPFGPEQVVPGLATDADLLAAYAGRAVPAVKRVWQLPEVTRATPEAGPTGR